MLTLTCSCLKKKETFCVKDCNQAVGPFTFTVNIYTNTGLFHFVSCFSHILVQLLYKNLFNLLFNIFC